MLKKGFLTKTLCLAAVLLMICAMACAESAPTQANPLAVITPAPGSMPAGYDPASEEYFRQLRGVLFQRPRDRLQAF